MQNSIGDAKRILPPYIVASQLKILMPVGTTTSIVATMKNVFAAGACRPRTCGAPTRRG